MTKKEFLNRLNTALWPISEADRQRSVDYYSEMIDDRMEDGLSEEEAVATIGNLSEIAEQILADTPRPPVVAVKPAKNPPHLESWMIVLLVLGSPVWIPLVAAAVSVVFSVYVSLWSVVIALYAVAVALGAAALGCILGSIFMFRVPGAVLTAIGTALICAGLAILIFMLSNLAAKGMIILTKLTVQYTKRIFTRKERAV